jgi:HSF-type DNA-binding
VFGKARIVYICTSSTQKYVESVRIFFYRLSMSLRWQRSQTNCEEHPSRFAALLQRNSSRHFPKNPSHPSTMPSDSAPRRQPSAASFPGRLDSSSFPAKVLLLLHSVEEENMSHIVSWQPHGRSFMVHNQKEFQSQILPRYVGW